ncbi:MAG: ABC transporter permease subunit [Puniceicoccales bacterium]|nr:ABC transporter permease subunit [Puniceicoccales bacterium]
MKILIGYEFQCFFVSPFFYAVCALFFSLMGILFFISLKVYADFQQEDPLMIQLFKSVWLPLLLIIPILTTKAIVSEKTEKRFDSLLVLPVNSFLIVFSKFIAIYCVHLALWTIVIYFPEIAQSCSVTLAQSTNLVTTQVRWGGWCFVNLLGGVVIAFGLWVSAHAKMPATSMAATTVGIFLFLVLGQLFKQASTIASGWSEIFETLYSNWNVFFQLEDFCRGIFDSRVIIAYVTATFGILCITALTLRGN